MPNFNPGAPDSSQSLSSTPLLQFFLTSLCLSSLPCKMGEKFLPDLTSKLGGKSAHLKTLRVPDLQKALSG